MRNKCNVSLFRALDFGLEASSGPFFFENATGQAITVNGAYHRDSIIQFFVSKLQDMDDAIRETRFWWSKLSDHKI